MIKLLATDLDGTLFKPKRRFRLITNKNKKFLKYLHDTGRRVVLVSGRNGIFCSRLSKRAGIPLDMIACNGSQVLKDGELFMDSPLSSENVRKFYEENKTNSNIMIWMIMSDSHPMIVIPQQMNWFLRNIFYVGLKCQFAYGEKFAVGMKAFDKLLNDPKAKIYKVMLIFGLGKKAIEKARLESLKFIDAYDTIFEVNWSRESVEFMNKGINKANALKKFIDVLGLRNDEVAVVGDSGNDVPLFEAFENSFVMSNASSHVKHKAKTEIKGVYCIKDYID